MLLIRQLAETSKLLQGCLSAEVSSELNRFEAVVTELLHEGADLDSSSEEVSSDCCRHNLLST